MRAADARCCCRHRRGPAAGPTSRRGLCRPPGAAGLQVELAGRMRVGPHRIWYVGGRYAYVSIHSPEFTDQVLAIVDLAEPTRPEIVGKWWIPGMWTGGGETPS